GELVAGVVDVVTLGGIGALALVDPRTEADAVGFEPGHVDTALLAIAAQGVVPHHVSHLLLEVLVHLLGVVVPAPRLLVRGAAAIVDTAAEGGGATALEAVEGEHIGARGAGFEGGADTGAAVAHHHHVGAFLPLHLAGVADPQGLLHIGRGVVTVHRTPAPPRQTGSC